MASVINIDLSGFEKDLKNIKDALSDTEALLRPVSIELAGIMKERIHVEGQASDGSQMGTYNNSYLKIRERMHKHSQSETKVILIFSRKLSNSWGAFATERGYGVGFIENVDATGVTSLKKIQYAEEHFGKKIGDLSKSEEEYAFERINELSTEIIGRT